MNEITMDFRTLSEIWFSENEYNQCFTHRRALFTLIQHANRRFGSKNINEIKPLDISELVRELAEKNPNTGKPAAKKTLQTLVSTLYRIFDMAIDNDWLVKNPAKNKNKFVPKNAPKKEVVAISKYEQKLIVDVQHRCQIAAMIMMFMGLRTGELLALEWNDIDLVNRRAYIHRHIIKIANNKYVSEEGTKTMRARYVTIPEELCKYLSFEKKKATSHYVFSKKDGKMHTPSSFQSAWQGYLNTLNYEEYKKNFGENISKFDPKGYPKTIKISPHQLRHTYATLLYYSNMDPLTTSKLLGHTTVDFTLNTYTHLDEKNKTLDISSFNKYISEELGRT